MKLDQSKLENVKIKGDRTTARCPACAEFNSDSTGNHLSINSEGKFGCVANQGSDGTGHRKRIFELVGTKANPAEKSTWTALPHAPANAPAPSFKHYTHGTPSAHWEYTTQDGLIVGYVARFDLANGKKETLPMSWCKDQHGKTGWQWKALPEPRPLYGLPFTEDFVVIVEGEKTAEAVRKAGLPATTWAGGCGAVSKTDFATLTGKTVILWPDNDEAGRKAMQQVARILLPITEGVMMVEIPDGMPNGWDAADTDNAEIQQLVDEAMVIDAQELEPAPEPLKFTFTHADDLSDEEGAFDFVEDVLTDGAVSVIYGASNSGKTFFVLDLAAHIATGRGWQEKEVEQGAVLYIALEGTQGARNRLKAMKLRGILPQGAPFFVSSSPVNLLDPTHPAEITRLIQAVTKEAKLPVRFVIIDTMARAMAGGDENSGEDMGTAVETIDAIKNETGAHITIIHHCGKDAARGARGHSSLRAAIDTEIEVIHPEGDKYRTATIVKQRDLATIAPLCFSLEPVEVGVNRRGKAITSCVVRAEDGMMAHTKGRVGAPRKYTCEMVLELLPQPSVVAWKLAAKEVHGMGEDAFSDRKKECENQWEKVGNQITIKPIQNKGKGYNGDNLI